MTAKTGDVPTATQRQAPPAAEKKPAPMALNKNDFKDDPLIKRALEVFRGQIVEVRG